MLALSAARALIQEKAAVLPANRVPLAGAMGRLLRESIHAPEDVPAFDRSAMDGYACHSADSAGRWRVVAEVQPGESPAELRLQPGECARVFTGAAIPPGADCVIMQEDTQREGEWMLCPERLVPGEHIRRRGEDVRAGVQVLPAGTRLGPGELAVLASFGVVQPLVSPAPRVVHVATGRELVSPERQPAPGEIRDSNSTFLAAELARAGAALVAQTRCGDDLAGLVTAVRDTEAQPWDLLLISGGASVGDYDFGARALTELGFTIHFTKLNLRPGKPLVFASRGAQLAFVIPGNPVSHFVLFQVAIRAALDALTGAKPAWSMLLVELATPLEDETNPRDTYWPACLTCADGRWQVQPLKWQSSGDVTGLLRVNALLHLPGGQPPPTERAQVLVLPQFSPGA